MRTEWLKKIEEALTAEMPGILIEENDHLGNRVVRCRKCKEQVTSFRMDDEKEYHAEIASAIRYNIKAHAKVCHP